MCDVIPMEVYPLLLERTWKYDINVVHDGTKNTDTLEKNGRTHMLLPIKDKKVKEEERNTILLMSGKVLLDEVRKEEYMQFYLVRKPRVILTITLIYDLPDEIQELLENLADTLVDDLTCLLSPIRSISHRIDLIPRVILPNKAVYRLTL